MLLTKLKAAATAFIRDDAMSLAAAVAFYTALSFAPLVLLLAAAGNLLDESTRGRLVDTFAQQLGPRAAELTDTVVRQAQDAPRASTFRWIMSSVFLLATASGVFAQLQSSLNAIWHVEAAKSSSFFAWIRKRLLSMGMVFAVLFILLVSLFLSTTIEFFVPRGAELAARFASIAVSFAVVSLLFAAIFKILPDARLSWRDVTLGSLVTAGLFTLGKELVSLYLQRGRVGDDYGHAAGALIALLVWVYYSCIILFIGAEITKAFASPAAFAPSPTDPPAQRPPR